MKTLLLCITRFKFDKENYNIQMYSQIYLLKIKIFTFIY